MPIHAQTGPPASAQAISTTPTRMRMPLSIPPTFFFMVYLSFCSKTARRAGPVGIVSKPDIPLGGILRARVLQFRRRAYAFRAGDAESRIGMEGREGAGKARVPGGVRAERKRSVEGVAEGLGRHELHHLAGGNLDTGPGLRVATGAGRAFAHLELAETRQGELLSMLQGVTGDLRQLIEQGADLGLGEVGGFGEIGNQLLLAHGHRGLLRRLESRESNRVRPPLGK